MTNTSTDATAVELTKNYIIFAAGNKLVDNDNSLRNAKNTNWTDYNSNLTGVKITSEGFWVATGEPASNGNASTRALVAITPSNIQVGVVEYENG